MNKIENIVLTIITIILFIPFLLLEYIVSYLYNSKYSDDIFDFNYEGDTYKIVYEQDLSENRTPIELKKYLSNFYRLTPNYLEYKLYKKQQSKFSAYRYDHSEEYIFDTVKILFHIELTRRVLIEKIK